MRLKKREIPNSRREMNVQEGDGVKKRESPPKEGDLTCMHFILNTKEIKLLVHLHETWFMLLLKRGHHMMSKVRGQVYEQM